MFRLQSSPSFRLYTIKGVHRNELTFLRDQVIEQDGPAFRTEEPFRRARQLVALYLFADGELHGPKISASLGGSGRAPVNGVMADMMVGFDDDGGELDDGKPAGEARF